MQISLLATDSRHPTTFTLHREHGSSDHLFVLFKSPAMLWVDGNYVFVNDGTCVLFDKNAKQSYFPCNGEEFLHDFIHFDFHSESERVLLADVPKNQPINLLLPSQITECLALIEKEKRSGSSYQNEILSSLGMAFLYRIKSESQKNKLSVYKHKYYKQLYDIRSEIYKNPSADWTIERILGSIFISRSYLQHTYKELFGTTCLEDVILARINYAKTLLLNDNIPVSEVSEACGYHSTEHFIRQFTKFVGTTPNKYRKRR